jgi:DNA-binding NtrC family response regulator
MDRRTVLLLHRDPLYRCNAAQYLRDRGYRIYESDEGRTANAFVDEVAFSAVVASLRTSDDTTGIDVLVHYELVSPGRGKILITDFLTNKVEYLVNFIGALCVSTQLSNEKLLFWVESVLPPERSENQVKAS